jgi:N-acetylmuramoyl-L-alanine amidase
MTILLYLGKVLVCSAILMGYYWLFLRNKRFHHYNRFYLQATLLLSVILPFIKIRVGLKPENPVNQAVYQTLDVLTTNYGEGDEPAPSAGVISSFFTIETILYGLYIAGIMVLLWILVKSIIYIKRISNQYPYERIDELRFYSTREPGTPFSFFRSIFWNNELPFNSREGQQIFRHELFHVQQKHSFDIIFTEIITAFFWYNPFFHLLKKELKAIHEFLADEYAISGSDRYTYAELLVMQTLKARSIPVTNYFFQNHIKRRITMIMNLTSSRYGYFSRLMILPVSVLLFCVFALYAQQPQAQVPVAQFTSPTKNKPITVVIDAGHGGSDNGAVSADGLVKEKDLALQISLKIQQLAPAYNVKVVMTRTTNDLPGNSTIKEDGIRARTIIAEQSHADAFISIHTSAVTPEIAAEEKKTVSDYNGIEVYITRDNEKWMAPSKALGSSVLQTLNSLYTTYPALKQRTQKGIWVLDHSPCPAILIECGYITYNKDLAFFSDNSNQEKLAKKILEGLVNYNNHQSTTSTSGEGPAGNSQAVVPNGNLR